MYISIVQALPGQSTPEGVPAFKLVLVGDGGTGDSTYHWYLRAYISAPRMQGLQAQEARSDKGA
jgi:hypothetical protein